jgi:hypothetical protein
MRQKSSRRAGAVMPFVRIEGEAGLFFVPEEQPCDKKKHACADCHSCQWCADERCELCLKRKPKPQACIVEEKKK